MAAAGQNYERGEGGSGRRRDNRHALAAVRRHRVYGTADRADGRAARSPSYSGGAASRQGRGAGRAGIMVPRGAGFDVVPSDCLAAPLKRRLPSATHLTLALSGRRTRASRGTTLSALENAPRGGRIRRAGVLARA